MAVRRTCVRLRCADAAAAHGIYLRSDRSSPLTPRHVWLRSRCIQYNNNNNNIGLFTPPPPNRPIETIIILLLRSLRIHTHARACLYRVILQVCVYVNRSSYDRSPPPMNRSIVFIINFFFQYINNYYQRRNNYRVIIRYKILLFRFNVIDKRGLLLFDRS